MRAPVILLAAALFASCSLFSDEEIATLSLPLPLKWRIKSTTEELKDGRYMDKKSDRIVLSVGKGGITAFLAGEANSADEYGAIYPYQTELTEDGLFPAQVAFALFTYGDPDNNRYYFNWSRLIECVRELDESERLILDEADAERLALKIRNHEKFSKSDVKHKEN